MKLFALRDYRLLFGAQVISLFGTGLTTVALGLLAYQLVGTQAGAVLATAMIIKMVLYVSIAPVMGAFADRISRRTLLVALDLVRAAVVVALPFVTEVWQIYVLVGVLQAASAAFTPTYQAVIPDVVKDKGLYTKALSASQVAYTMESLLSPVLAAVALLFMGFNWLFLGTVFGFLASAALVLAARIPRAAPLQDAGLWHRLSLGVRTFLGTAPLRGVMALNLVQAAVGSIVVINTVNYVRDVLGGSQSSVAWVLASSGLGTLVTALLVPWALTRFSDRSVMLAGASVLVGSAIGLAFMAANATASWALTYGLWLVIGMGLGLIATPIGRVIRAAVAGPDTPAAFAAQFSLSHLAWLITYPIAGLVAAAYGLVVAWIALAALAVVGLAVAALVWREADALRASVDASAAAEPSRV